MARVGKQKLLVVEDDIGVQSQLEWAFGAYEVMVAADRKTALSAVRAHRPAVVTLDLGLPPDADGASEGLAALREIVAISPETKVIVASGHEARESAQTAIALGAFDFYAKPIEVKTDAEGRVSALVYERTRSLYPVIALHAFNNSIAFATQANGAAVSAVLGPLMIGICMLAPRLTRPAPAPV